jgi:phosphoglycolate phosphatase-like HAD superfamily hydrolase
MIHSIMRSAGIASALHVAKVGDTAVDMMEGKTAGCGLVIGVTTGAYTRAQLLAYDPDAVIDSLLELPMILNLGPDAE